MSAHKKEAPNHFLLIHALSFLWFPALCFLLLFPNKEALLDKWTMSSAQQLYNAILANSPDLVKSCLDIGTNPNKHPLILTLKDIRGNDNIIPKSVLIVRDSNLWCTMPLHIAVINCYHNGYRWQFKRQWEAHTLQIIQYLIDAGAKTEETAYNVSVCNIQGYKWKSPGTIMPIDLTVFLM